jgi:hypothetical protein
MWSVILGAGHRLVAVLTPWSMGMGLRRRGRHELLPWHDDVAWFTLFDQVFRNLRMVGPHIADKPTEEPLRLKVRTGKA